MIGIVDLVEHVSQGVLAVGFGGNAEVDCSAGGCGRFPNWKRRVMSYVCFMRMSWDDMHVKHTRYARPNVCQGHRDAAEGLAGERGEYGELVVAHGHRDDGV